MLVSHLEDHLQSTFTNEQVITTHPVYIYISRKSELAGTNSCGDLGIGDVCPERTMNEGQIGIREAPLPFDWRS